MYKVAVKWYNLGLELLNSRQLGRQELPKTTENDFIKDGAEICCRKMFWGLVMLVGQAGLTWIKQPLQLSNYCYKVNSLLS